MMKDKIYLIEKNEFLLLAAAAGITKIYGFNIQTDDLTYEDNLLNLQGLVTKEYIVVENEKFILSSELCNIFAIIKDAQTYMDVHKKSGRKCIIYISDKAVKVSQSMRRNEVFEVNLVDNSDVWKLLVDDGWIPG